MREQIDEGNKIVIINCMIDVYELRVLKTHIY